MSEQQEQAANIEKLIEVEKKRAEDYLIRLRYLQADFDNLKKRCDRQIEDARSYAAERLILQLLDVVDELELAVKSGEASNDGKPLLEGVTMTLKKLRKVLEQEGVSPIECQGKIFDPSKHNAIESKEREGVEGCVVGEEVRKGYIMKGKVIRPSIVKVEMSPSKPSKLQTEKIDKMEKE